MPVPIIHLSRSFRAPQTTIRPALFIYQTSPLSSTSRFLYPQKGAEDKDSIDRESTEYSKSGTDDQSAAQEEAAFDADKTSPESQKEKAGEGNGVSPWILPSFLGMLSIVSRIISRLTLCAFLGQDERQSIRC